MFQRHLMFAIALALGLIASGTAMAQTVCDPAGVNHQQVVKHLANGTAFNIDAGHIFCGNVNGQGNSTGFHSRPGGADPATVHAIGGGPNPDPARPGIYTLTGIQITQNGAAGNAKPLSTMYPDGCTQNDVMDAVENAVRTLVGGVGSSGAFCQLTAVPPQPFDIRVILDAGGNVLTAYPN